MSTFIVVATSKDGFIANESHVYSWHWTSQADKNAFKGLTRASSPTDRVALVMGSKTFETFARNGEPAKPLPGRPNVVYSRSDTFRKAYGLLKKDFEITDKDPAALVRDLILRGFNKIAVIGGARIYQMFLDAGEVSTVYMTVEPIKFGHGIPFAVTGWEKRFGPPESHFVKTELGRTEFRTYRRK